MATLLLHFLPDDKRHDVHVQAGAVYLGWILEHIRLAAEKYVKSQ